MVSIVIPSYKRASVVSGVLASLMHQDCFKEYPCEILISIDDSDPELEIYKDYISQFEQIYLQFVPKVEINLIINQTKGLVEAKNKAVEESKYDLVMMLDDDLILEPNYISELVKETKEDKSIGAISGYIVTFKPAISHTQPSDKLKKIPVENHLQTLKIEQDSDEWRSVFGQKEQVMDWSEINRRLPSETRYTMDYFVNSYLFRKGAFKKINGYNSSLNSKTSAHEEVDFTYRIMTAGYKLVFNPFVRMWHWTIGRGGIYKGEDFKSSKEMLEEEYNESLPKFLNSVKSLHNNGTLN